MGYKRIDLSKNHRLERLLTTEDMINKFQITNSGLVLLNAFIPKLFENLDIVENDSFISDEAQQNSAAYLQFLASGITEYKPQDLVLNKVLCGLVIAEELPNSFTISEAHKDEMDSLITAVIGHWRALGSLSIEGFRGNWLQRAGLLIEHPNHFELIVEKYTFDILLDTVPMSYSMVNFPWMPKPIMVDW